MCNSSGVKFLFFISDFHYRRSLERHLKIKILLFTQWVWRVSHKSWQRGQKVKTVEHQKSEKKFRQYLSGAHLETVCRGQRGLEVDPHMRGPGREPLVGVRLQSCLLLHTRQSISPAITHMNVLTMRKVSRPAILADAQGGCIPSCPWIRQWQWRSN